MWVLHCTFSPIPFSIKNKPNETDEPNIKIQELV